MNGDPLDVTSMGDAALPPMPDERAIAAAATIVDTDGRRRPRRDPSAEHLASDLEILRWRVVASLTIGAAVMVLPMFGDHRFQIGALILFCGITSNLLTMRWVRRGRAVPAVLALVDLAIAASVVVLVPEAYGVMALVLVSDSGLFVFWFGPRAAASLLPPTGLTMLAVGLWAEPTMWIPYLAAWFITSSTSTVVFGQVSRTLRAERNRYDELVNGIDAVVWAGRGPSGPADYISDHVVALLGFDVDEMEDEHFVSSHIHPDDLPVYLESRRLVAEGQDIEVHFRMIDAWGRTRRLQDRVKVTVDSGGRVVRRRGVLVDETAQWEAEASARSYTDFVAGIPIALVTLRLEDADDPSSLTLTAANPAARDVADVDSDAIGHRLVDLIPIGDELLGHLARAASDGTPHDEPFVQIEGNDEIYALRAVPLPDRCVGISLEDITKRARTAEAFRHQATHDVLTGLPNRALLHERLTRALIEADRTTQPVALLLVDLDQFKDVNDALGHEYGDALLRELARRMSTRLRGCDTVARLGGDEFAVLLTTDATTGGAEEVARRITQLAEEPVQVGQYRLQVSASVGIAIAPEHGNDAETLMRRADGAMYDAKQAGGGHVVYCPRQELTTVRRLELLADLREAESSDDFEVHYQPRIDLHTMQPVGIEALVRWRHPRHGLLAPKEFIELAEVSGTIRDLTRAVATQASAALGLLAGRTALNGSTAGIVSASINLSTRNLYDPVLVDWLVDECTDGALPAGSLFLELTERQLMDDPRQIGDVIHRLHALGIRFSIDDFGSGPSSLALIRDLPIDDVKIDRRFVQELTEGDDRIVRSIIDVGHHLGLTVTAEGVEDLATVDRLRRLGCDAAQGFALVRPMPIDELVTHMDSSAPDAWRAAVTDR